MKSLDELIEYIKEQVAHAFDAKEPITPDSYRNLYLNPQVNPDGSQVVASPQTEHFKGLYCAYSDILERVENLKKNTGWVKIDYRDKSTLPKNYESVFIVTADLIIVGVGTWYDTKAQIGWYFPDGEFFDSHYVKYWLPIPELPKN
jgi:hypothetical protein